MPLARVFHSKGMESKTLTESTKYYALATLFCNILCDFILPESVIKPFTGEKPFSKKLAPEQRFSFIRKNLLFQMISLRHPNDYKVPAQNV